MRAVFSDDAGALRIQNVEAPTPKADEVRIRIQAAGLNRADLLQRRGLYPPPPGVTQILGLECAGVIESLGKDVNNKVDGPVWAVGNRVCAVVPGGAYADFCCVPATQLLPIPATVDFLAAAAVPEAAATAWRNIIMIGALQAQETIYINAGASGIGTAAIQIAKARGARVLTSAGTQAKIDCCLALGADLAINYKEEDVFAGIENWTAQHSADAVAGVDCILDMLGGDQFNECLKLLKPHGRLVVIGLLSGRKSQIDLSQLLRKSLKVTASTLRSASQKVKNDLAAELRRDFIPLWVAPEQVQGQLENHNGKQTGQFRAIVDSVFNIEDVEAAHAHMQAKRNVGKIVLRLS